MTRLVPLTKPGVLTKVVQSNHTFLMHETGGILALFPTFEQSGLQHVRGGIL